MTYKSVFLSLALAAVSSATAFAQENPFTFNLGAGGTAPVYGTGTRHDTGWNALAGVGFHPIPFLGVRGEFQYNSFDVNGTTLTSLAFPNGNTSVWSLTLNPVINLGARGPVSAYLIGGGGLYRRNTEFTTPTIASVTAYDPYFNYFYRVGVPADQVLASQSVLKPGVNGGAGISFRVGSRRTRIFAEARYHHMYTQPRATTYLPVTVGIQW